MDCDTENCEWKRRYGLQRRQADGVCLEGASRGMLEMLLLQKQLELLRICLECDRLDTCLVFDRIFKKREVAEIE